MDTFLNAQQADAALRRCLYLMRIYFGMSLGFFGRPQRWRLDTRRGEGDHLWNHAPHRKVVH